MKRREFFKTSIQATGSLALAAYLSLESQANLAPAINSASNIPSATRQPQSAPAQNRQPLLPSPFLKLPIGSIQPKGWLLRQLEIQAEGLNGRMPEISDYLVYEGNGWVTPGSDFGWEEVPYWLRGFGDLGYVTGNAPVIALARKWTDGILDAQQPDGWFGPNNLRTSLDGGPDMWPHMPVLDALRSYYEYSSDERVISFMTKYAAFQAKVPGEQFAKSWAGFRWGDNIDSLYWLYNRTGDTWLLDLAANIHDHSARWSEGIASYHNVNIAQGFREGAQYWQQSHLALHRESAYRNYEAVMAQYGQFSGGGFAGDENCRPGYSDPRQGFETCGIVEFMHSHELLTRITGDAIWADRCEELAFNSLPAALEPLQRGVHYITSANSVSLDNDSKAADFDNTFPMQAYMPGIHNYRCCPHNYGMGWPYYAEEMWLANADGGICASLYGASEVRAQLGRHRDWVQISQQTHYPFGDLVEFEIMTEKAEPVAFPFAFRVPGWCRQAKLTVNGEPLEQTAAAGTYTTICRRWRSGDVIKLHLLMQTVLKRWPSNHDSVSIHRGPLTYSLEIAEEWRQSGGSAGWPEYEVHAASPWNYGMLLDSERASGPKSIIVAQNSNAALDNPWMPNTSPVKLTTQARRIPAWQADTHNVVGPLQASPVNSDQPDETITLIPMGAARLRITSFPVIGDGPDT